MARPSQCVLIGILYLDAVGASQALGEALREIHRTVMSPVAAECDLQVVAALDHVRVDGLPHKRLGRIQETVDFRPVLLEEFLDWLVEAGIAAQGDVVMRIRHAAAVENEPAPTVVLGVVRNPPWIGERQHRDLDAGLGLVVQVLDLRLADLFFLFRDPDSGILRPAAERCLFLGKLLQFFLQPVDVFVDKTCALGGGTGKQLCVRKVLVQSFPPFFLFLELSGEGSDLRFHSAAPLFQTAQVRIQFLTAVRDLCRLLLQPSPFVGKLLNGACQFLLLFVEALQGHFSGILLQQQFLFSGPQFFDLQACFLQKHSGSFKLFLRQFCLPEASLRRSLQLFDLPLSAQKPPGFRSSPSRVTIRKV